jgi:ribonuclease T
MNILYIDTETTGTEPGKHSLIELAAVLYKDEQRTSEYHFYQPPNKSVSLSALKYNKVKIADFLSMQQSEVKSNFAGFVDYLLDLPKGTIICGHNVAFDIAFIKAEAANFNLEDVGSVLPYGTLDTKTIALAMQSAGLILPPNTSLVGLAEYLDIAFDRSKLHGAKYDVELTIKVYAALNHKLKSLFHREV